MWQSRRRHASVHETWMRIDSLPIERCSCHGCVRIDSLLRCRHPALFVFPFCLPPCFAHILEFRRQTLHAVLLHSNMRVEMVERAVRLGTTLVVASVESLHLVVPPSRPLLVRPCAAAVSRASTAAGIIVIVVIIRVDSTGP